MNLIDFNKNKVYREIELSERELSDLYLEFFSDIVNIEFVREVKDAKSNYWLNAVVLESKIKRNEFLEFTNPKGIMTRPIWGLMNKLEMFKDCPKSDLSNAEWLEDRVVNITSSVRVNE